MIFAWNQAKYVNSSLNQINGLIDDSKILNATVANSGVINYLTINNSKISNTIIGQSGSTNTVGNLFSSNSTYLKTSLAVKEVNFNNILINESHDSANTILTLSAAESTIAQTSFNGTSQQTAIQLVTSTASLSVSDASFIGFGTAINITEDD